jgi:hypothetical protein
MCLQTRGIFLYAAQTNEVHRKCETVHTRKYYNEPVQVNEQTSTNNFALSRGGGLSIGEFNNISFKPWRHVIGVSSPPAIEEISALGREIVLWTCVYVHGGICVVSRASPMI